MSCVCMTKPSNRPSNFPRPGLVSSFLILVLHFLLFSLPRSQLSAPYLTHSLSFFSSPRTLDANLIRGALFSPLTAPLRKRAGLPFATLVEGNLGLFMLVIPDFSRVGAEQDTDLEPWVQQTSTANSRRQARFPLHQRG